MLPHIKNYEIEDKVYSTLVVSIKYFLVFVVSYVLILTIVDITNVKYVSAINLGLFSLFLALLITSSILILEKKHRFLQINLPKIVQFDNISSMRITLIIGSIVFFLAYLVINNAYYYYIAFEEWNTISPFRLLVSVVILLELFYIPAYILHRTLIRRFKLGILERLTFYPVISALILAPLGILAPVFRLEVFYKVLFLLFFNTALIIFLLYDYLNTGHAYSLPSQASINLTEILGIAAVIAFNLFLFYSEIGPENAFLRGDMYAGANQVAFLLKYGLNGYMVSQVQRYPIIYPMLWSTVSGLLPVPFINGLIIIAFFNQVFSILALYTLAKVLFKDTKSALITVILWTLFSGFSWLYVVLNPPLQMLGGNDLLNYVNQISYHFGVYSGSIISFETTAFNSPVFSRLWSMSLFFVSTAALLKGYLNGNPDEGLLVFSAGLILVSLGHIIEIPLFAIVLFTLILIEKKLSIRFIKKALIIMTIVSVVTIIISILFNIFGKEILIFIFFLPVMAILIATVLKKIYTYVKEFFSKKFIDKIQKNIKFVLIILFLYLYGLMWIAFWTKYPNVWINWPIFTVWYAPAIEWGFLGLTAVLTLVWLGFKERWEFGLKFIVFIFVFQLFFIIALNYLNYNFYYIQTPYPLEPVLFLPTLALISSKGFTNVKLNFFKKRLSQKTKLYMYITFIILIFSFGSIGHILTTSYWKTSNGWWHYTEPLNPSYLDYQFINFLYLLPATSSYEYIITFHDWKTPGTYVIYPSGLAPLSKPLIDIISSTNDSREIYLSSHIFSFKYILVSNAYPPPTNSYLSNAIKTINPIFANDKYELYLFSQLNLSKTELLPSANKFLTAENITFRGDISLMDFNGIMFLHNVSGTIYPVNDGKVVIRTEFPNGTTENITTLTPTLTSVGNLTLNKMKSTWGYFDEIECIADKLVISGGVSFRIFNTFEHRIYMESFNYYGTYNSLPITFLGAPHIKQQIENYRLINYVSPLKVLTTPIGSIWTIINITILLIGLIPLARKRVYRYIK